MPRRAFTITLAIAFFLHVPFVPSNLAEWLRLALFHAPDEPDDPDAQAVIPINLDLLSEAPSAEEPAAPTPAPPAAPANAAGEPVKKPDGQVPIADAGAARDAGPPDAAPSASASSQVDAGPPPLRDPMNAAGGAGKVASKDPNVQVLIAGNVIRKHELGAAFSRILVLIPEWHQFFEGSPIDPIRDLNHLLITAPRLRGNFEKMVAVMDFNVPEPKIRGAVDIVVQSAEGEWLDDAPVPTARAKVQGSDRLFALVPGKRLLVVLPLEAKDQLSGLRQTRGFPSSSVGILISMITPARPFRGIFPLPDTLKWMRVAVTPTSDGGADVAVEAGDKSPEDAEKHALEITRAFDAIRTIDMVLTRIDVLDHADFRADRDVIKAQVHVTTRQLKLILGFAEQQLREQAVRRAGPGAATASPPTPAMTSSAGTKASP